MQAHAIAGPWAAGRTCAGLHQRASGLVRPGALCQARRRPHAGALDGRLCRNGRATITLPEKERDRVDEALRLAERLGGDAVTLPGNQIAADLIDYARANNITQIIIGKSTGSRWFELAAWLGGARSGARLRQYRHPCRGRHARSRKTVRRATRSESRDPVQPDTLHRQCRHGGPGLAGQPRHRSFHRSAQHLDDVPGGRVVLGCAIWAAALALRLDPLSTLAYNYFFLDPVHTFTVADPSNIIALFFFLTVAMLTSNLTAKVRAEARASRQRAASTTALYTSAARWRRSARWTISSGRSPTRSP